MLCLIFAVLFYVVAALNQFRGGNLKITMLLIVSAGFFIRLFCALDPMLHEWDERYHALVAKNLMANPLLPRLYESPILPFDFRAWATNQVWLHKQPLPLWSMAFSMKIFGVHELAVRLPSLVLSTISIWLTYLLGKQLFSEKTGVFAAILQSLNGFVIEIGAGRIATDHVDLFFMFFVQLSVWFAFQQIKKDDWRFSVLSGLACGCAVLCKWLPALIVLPVFMVATKVKLPLRLGQALLMLAAAMAVFMPWQVYAALSFPKEYWWEMRYNARHFTEMIEGQGGEWHYYLNKARINWNELIYLPFVWACVVVFRKKAESGLVPILVWILLPYVFFSFAQTKMMGYALFIAPAVFLLSAHFLEKFEWRRFPKVGFYLKIAFLLLAVRYCVERVKPVKNREKEVAVRARILEIGNSYSGTKTVLVNTPYPIETMFLTEMPAYEFASPEQQKRLEKMGWVVRQWVE